jgi:type IV secretion system protein TrbI
MRRPIRCKRFKPPSSMPVPRWEANPAQGGLPQPVSSQLAGAGPQEQRTDYERQNDQQQKAGFGQQHGKQESEYLNSARKPALGKYEIKAGWLIPAVLEQQLNSDLPGLIRALVRENVYDSATGRYILVPAGSTLVGIYNSHVGYGQSALQAVWQRLSSRRKQPLARRL